MSARTPEGPSAVLLMGYGSPTGADDLPAYLAEVMHGRRPPPEMVAEYVRRYDRIGGSPQNRILASLREKLERRLAAERPGTRVFLGVKHGHPALREVIPEAARAGVRHLVAVPLSPYASTWISEPYRAGVEEGIRAAPRPISVDVRFGWHLDPNWIGYWARAIRADLARRSDSTEAVLLTAHSLPQRMRDRGDPYPEIVRAASDSIARAADLPRWSFAFQSAGNTTEPWMGPDITDVMREWRARGARRQLVASFGFVFDHLEVLYDLDVVVREFAEGLGIEYRRVAMPNDAEEVVAAVAARVAAPSEPDLHPAPRSTSRGGATGAYTPSDPPEAGKASATGARRARRVSQSPGMRIRRNRPREDHDRGRGGSTPRGSSLQPRGPAP